MHNVLNKADLFVVLWIMYYAQGFLYPEGSFISRLLLIVLLFVSIFYFVFANLEKKKNIFFWGLNALTCLLLVYGFKLILSDVEFSINVPRFNYLKTICLSLLPIYLSYQLSKQGFITKERLKKWGVFFLIYAFLMYEKWNGYMVQFALANNLESEEVTNNAGYIFLILIPIFLYIYETKLIKIILVAICSVFLFLSMKRGAIFIGCIFACWYVWLYFKIDFSLKKLFLFLIGFIAGAGLLYKGVSVLYEDSQYFQLRVDDTLQGKTSGRDKLYDRFSTYFWEEASPMQFVFGSGANATIQIYYNYAHNDWLELSVNQGVLGILVYIFYWCVCFRTCYLARHNKKEFFVLSSIFIVYFFRTFFDHSYEQYTLPVFVTLGFALCSLDKDLKLSSKKEVG